MSKIKTVLYLYTIPLVFMVLFPLIKTVELNGEQLGTIGLMASGFIIGIAFEGFLLIMTATGLILTGKLDSVK